MTLDDPFVRSAAFVVLLGGCSAHEPTKLRDRATGMTVAVTMVGTLPASAKTRSTIVYRHTRASSSSVADRASASGTEDFVTFDAKPAAEELRYRVDVSRAAGLRLVAGVLELLDGAGVPRLRMAAPYLVDGNGTRHDATVALEGCAADDDPAGPWGRPVTSPGAHDCTVLVKWGGVDDRIIYPAVLDPAWTATTNTMTTPRRGHTATLLGSGKVLVVGGEAPSGQTTVHLKSAELFDPSTNTFAATTPMTDGRSFHSAVLLKNGNVLVTGGAGDAGPLASSEVYDLAKPGFRASGPLLQARREAGAVLLGSGDVLLAGGVDASGLVLKEAEVFASTGEAWSVTDSMTERRVGYYLTWVGASGAMAVAGVTTTTGLGDLSGTELYDPAGKTFSDGATLAEERFYFAGATFPNDNVLVAGGYDLSVNANTATAELFDDASASWSSAGSLTHARMNHTLTAFPSGAAVAAGGVVMKDAKTITSYLKSAELYDPTARTWAPLPDMSEARFFHTATLLTDGRVLVTGGDGPSGPTDTAETLSLDANGVTCASAASCGSGFCADGVCCGSACTQNCDACAKASTGKADGTCAPVLAGKDPRNDCTDDGTPLCGNDGACDGAGACEKYTSKPCKPNACASDADCTSAACADGICCDQACSGTCEACTAAKKGTGSDGSCGPVAAATDPDKECGTLGQGVCQADGTCDGAGACEVPTAGKACAAAECSDPSTLSAAALCGKAGDCTPVTTDCTPFACDAAKVSCKTTCATDKDCATGAHCTAGACVKSPNGAACTAATECTSASCVDGHCCDKACAGQCEACDVAGVEGTCTAVAGPPHSGRAACAGTGACASACNGLDSDCVFPNGASCGSTVTCADDSETAELCNPLGACVATPVHPCAPFGCGAAACNTTCKADADCATGATCDPSGTCVTTGSAATCAGTAGVTLPDGGVATCGAFLCVGGACTTSCKKDSDCATNAKCNAAGKCAVSETSGGCGCRMSTDSAPKPAAALAALAGLLGYARRRRRSASLSKRAPVRTAI